MGYATIVRTAWKKQRLGHTPNGEDSLFDDNSTIFTTNVNNSSTLQDDSVIGTEKEKAAAGFGAHHIGLIGSLCLVCNNIIGPAMFQLPGLFQQTGWVPCMVAIVICAVWTTQSGLYLSQAMRGFKGRVEFNRLAYSLLPRWGYYIAVAVLCSVFFFQNLANILMTSQVMDETLLAMFKVSCSLDLQSFTPLCVHADTDQIVTDSLFGDSYVITVGYVIVLIVCIPLGILNLEDNILIQIGGMILTVVCILIWMINFIVMGLKPSYVPAFGSGIGNYTPLLSTILFNYGFVATLPSWLNEKSPKVPTTSTVIYANIAATTQYLIVAIFGALAVVVGGNTDLLSVINEGNIPGIWTVSQIMTFIFPIANVLTSIPVFSIIIRYNLLQLEGIKVPVWLANLIAVVLPWFIVLPFYPGNTLDSIITWSSALLFVLLNLIFPIIIYLTYYYRKVHNLPIDVHLDTGNDDKVPNDDSDNNNNNSLYSSAAENLLHRDLKDSLLLNSVLGTSSMGNSIQNSSHTLEEEEEENADEYDKIHPVCTCCGKVTERSRVIYARLLLGISVILAVAAIGLQIFQQVDPSTDDDSN